jgi:hypothetical protein
MADCRALAETVASWGGAVVPARVNWADGGWHKGSVRGWPAKASSDPRSWPDTSWFTWGSNWWVALCPRQGGLVAVDCDGQAAVDLLREAVAIGQVPWDDGDTPLTYRTPGHGGGLHLVYRWPPGLPAFSRRVVTTAEGAQIDLRGEGTFLLLCGAPRPDVGPDARYEMVSRPGEHGPPPLPDGFPEWMDSLGDVNVEAAPSLGAKQLSPEGLARMAAAQGGRLRADRHVALFRVASHLRVQRGTRTFEALATELWRLVEANMDIDGEEEHWQEECIRVARNAAEYTRKRDEMQVQAAAEMAERWMPRARRS